MEQDIIKTDQRLLTIMESGRKFLSAIDPQGLLADATPNQLILDFQLLCWKLRLAFESGTEIIVSGILKDNIPFISVITEHPAAKNNSFATNASETLATALGDLSRVPAWLKQLLSRNGLKKSLEQENQQAYPFLGIAADATFYKTEDTQPESSQRLFKKWKFNYIFNDEGNTIETEIVAIHKSKNSAIAVSTHVDIYGLGNKNVTLTKLLGENRTAFIECSAKTNGKTIPSIKAAFDLDKRIPVIYFPEKKETKTIGKPKAK